MAGSILNNKSNFNIIVTQQRGEFLNFIIAAAYASFCMLVGIYLLNGIEDSEIPLLQKIVGYANVVIFGGSMVLALIKLTIVLYDIYKKE